MKKNIFIVDEFVTDELIKTALSSSKETEPESENGINVRFNPLYMKGGVQWTRESSHL